MTKKHSTAGLDAPGLGARIRAIREMAGLSQEKFAQALGFTRRQVVAWETAVNGPPISILATIRRVFDIDPEWVVMGPGLKPLQQVGHQEQDRRERIEREVGAFGEQLGISIAEATKTKLVNMILKKQVADESEMKETVFEVIEAMAANDSQ